MNLFRYFRLLVAGLVLLCLGWASTAQAAIPASERAILTDLYASTNGASWSNNTNWNGGVGTECTWYGVACDGMQRHVVKIFLGGNRLDGTLPSLSGLTSLQEFDVRSNQLTGSIPSLSGLTALRVFWVGENYLTGYIPSLNGLTTLEYFQAVFNQLTGSIPSLSGLTGLRVFDVQNNLLTGPVPAAPTSLVDSYLCSNSLVSSGNPAIDATWEVSQSNVYQSNWYYGYWLDCQSNSSNMEFTFAYGLTVTRSGTGTGTVTSNPAGINCGSTCSSSFSITTSGYHASPAVTLTATPAAGSTFTGWSGDCTGTGTCTLNINRDKNVTATFNVTIAISDARVFAYAEANYPSLFAGTATAGQHQQYNYRHYPASGNYLAVDTAGVIFILGTHTGGEIISVGPVESFRSYITAWEAAP